MALLDHEGGANYPYPCDVVFEALLIAIPRVAGMELSSCDKVSRRVLAKAGVSLMSWGENIPIEVSEFAPGYSRVCITSSPKTGVLFGGAFDMGKNKKNIERILSELSHCLQGQSPTEGRDAASVPHGDTAERLAKLKHLADRGLITDEEYLKRKQEILSEL